MAEKEIILAQEYRLFLIRLPIYMGKMALTQKSAIIGRFSRMSNFDSKASYRYSLALPGSVKLDIDINTSTGPVVPVLDWYLVPGTTLSILVAISVLRVVWKSNNIFFIFV